MPLDIEEAYERKLESNKRYRLKHKNELKEKAHEYYLKNRDMILTKQRERNMKTCDDMKKHRQTLRNEMSKLIEMYELKLAELKGMLGEK